MSSLYNVIVIKVTSVCVFINFIQKRREARLDYLKGGVEMTGHLVIYNRDSDRLERSTFILAIVIYFIPESIRDSLSIRATNMATQKKEINY